ncbi:ER membrane protein complex subunit 10 [Clonorchis sinensis]|uniref:ER membrane protein complex subunit 10 n=1 Tax=Clonorchis sinensis TaxID=79923 RepID=A0A8T1M8P6_CLOSI|nr:ER membrane protein complex subunit 10 [Clonorchis sinensis]
MFVPTLFAVSLLLSKNLYLASTVALELEHSFDSGRSFQPFKQLTLSPTTGVLTISGASPQSNRKLGRGSLLMLPQSGDLYVVRINVTAADSLESSVLVCQLLASQMKLNLVLSVNDQGHPVAVHVSTPRYDCLSEDALSSLLAAGLPEISVNLDVQKPTTGSKPETLKYLQRLEKQREEMARAQKEDNRSFFAKYWTYIVPAVIIFIIFSSIQDAQSSGGRQ